MRKVNPNENPYGYNKDDETFSKEEAEEFQKHMEKMAEERKKYPNINNIIYLMNYAWEGFCRNNGYDNYEVGPFDSSNMEFALKYYTHIMSGGRFNFKIEYGTRKPCI